MTHRSSFGVANAGDFFRQIVLPQYADFLADNSSPRHALLVIIVAYHMYEWVHRRNFEVSHFERMYPSNKALANVFELARNITNGTKHFRSKAETRAHGGFGPGFGRPGFGKGFARPRLIVTTSDGTEQSDVDFLRQIVDFWKQQESAGAF